MKSSSYAFSIYFILISTFFIITINGNFSEQFAKTGAMHSATKMTHLHFYFHDIVSGEKPTVNIIFRGKNNVGTTAMIDDPLTEGTERGSKIVGRAQGMYAFPTKTDAALLMVINFSFLEGEYNGSTISILGRNPVLEKVREMPVVGGSGVFRFCHGYALAKTVRFNINTGDAVVEYDVYVMHF
ncbi:Dirigent protein [Heracleum sosnowskyi]|uniref:Dirigent protein n=1 Tax=Heracleum sosnowskyi TaxID=360622 RepID=A0AAD8MF57_9APIA|nr:Dirigent protein [Heracleum sosnowskyi]